MAATMQACATRGKRRRAGARAREVSAEAVRYDDTADLLARHDAFLREASRGA